MSFWFLKYKYVHHDWNEGYSYKMCFFIFTSLSMIFLYYIPFHLFNVFLILCILIMTFSERHHYFLEEWYHCLYMCTLQVVFLGWYLSKCYQLVCENVKINKNFVEMIVKFLLDCYEEDKKYLYLVICVFECMINKIA